MNNQMKLMLIKIKRKKDIQQQLLEMEPMEPMMDKELWLNFIFHTVLQRILLEIFMLEIVVQSE